MSSTSPSSVSIACSRCGRADTRFETFRAGEGEGMLHDRDRIVRTGFPGHCIRPMAFAEASVLVSAMAAGDLVTLFHQDRDFFGFFCQRCSLPYCGSCWRMDPPLFDEGFYDCTYAHCPAGHVQKVDD